MKVSREEKQLRREQKRALQRDRQEKRRQVLIIFGAGGAAAVAAGIPVVGVLLAPALTPSQTAWRAVGKVSDFQVGQTTEVKFRVADAREGQGVSSTVGAWLRRTSESRFVCFQMNCTHLGCPVHWVPSSELFLCPCHGGVYDQTGRNVAGPPRIPLRRHAVRLVGDTVEVQAQPIPLPGLNGPGLTGSDQRGAGS
ncbi:ubiquinol-cytochrome c reductase iron-sulfur subunit (plasmid) [Deinococcus radiomollis]|uniref:QcrA and Rieske domain-containing protein n=1 Tax=Deinococcus radiomollis TaxID=468916 RepID=UPI003891F4DA